MSKWYEDEPHDDTGMCEHVANLAYELERVLERHQSECGCGSADMVVTQFLVDLALGQPDDPDRGEVVRFLDKMHKSARRIIIETWNRGGP
jgi:hypothetical protein